MSYNPYERVERQVVGMRPSTVYEYVKGKDPRLEGISATAYKHLPTSIGQYVSPATHQAWKEHSAKMGKALSTGMKYGAGGAKRRKRRSSVANKKSPRRTKRKSGSRSRK